MKFLRRETNDYDTLKQTIEKNLKRNPHFYDPPAPPGAPSGEELWTQPGRGPLPIGGSLPLRNPVVAPRSTMFESDFEATLDKLMRVMAESGIPRTREKVRADLTERLAQRGTAIVPNKPVLPAPDPRLVTTLHGSEKKRRKPRTTVSKYDEDIEAVEEKARLLDRYTRAVVEAREGGQITTEQMIKLMENPDIGIQHMRKQSTR